MGSPLVSKVPVEFNGWTIDQYGSINYNKDSIRLSVSVDMDKKKVKINTKPLLIFKSEVFDITNKALECLNDIYEKSNDGITHNTDLEQNMTDTKEETKFMKFICRLLGKIISNQQASGRI